MSKIRHFILLPAAILVLLVGNGVVCSLPYGNAPSNVSEQEPLRASATGLKTDIPQTLLPSPLSASTQPALSASAQGSTIQHRVAAGEWLLQIARCYGADFGALRRANPNIADSNTPLLNGTVITVPKVGSVGKVYGPPCVTFYSVQAGDTWVSIAQRFDADLSVLQKVNPSPLTVGAMIKVPPNSAAPVSFTLQEGSLQEQSTLLPGETLRYQFTATKAERLTIRLQKALNRLALNISGMGLSLDLQDLAQAWNVSIPAGGSYVISVANVFASTATDYELLVDSLAGTATPVVSTVTVGANGTVEERIARITEAVEQHTMANIAYNVPPQTMQLGETLTMELLLNPSVDAEVLASQISESGPFQTAAIEITHKMKAELIQEAEGFAIVPFQDDPEQLIGNTENTKWTWYVTAKAPGTHKLTLVISRLILVDAEKNWIEAGTAYKSEINVTIPPGERIARFDWKWIATFILGVVGSALAILTWLNNRKREQREEATRKDQSARKVKKERKE